MLSWGSDLDTSKICLRRQGALVHDLCLARCKLLDAAFEAAIELQCWPDAAAYGRHLLAPYRLWYGQRHPLTAMLLLKVGTVPWNGGSRSSSAFQP